jgi:eukaryotic-like serine/threonine-protein kinase
MPTVDDPSSPQDKPRCSQCGSELPPGARFCPNDGMPAPPAFTRPPIPLGTVASEVSPVGPEPHLGPSGPKVESAAPDAGGDFQATAPTSVKVDPIIGARLGEYLVQERLGEGGMGIVYRGVQPLISKPVAIKVVRWEIARDPEQVHRLLAEARTIAAIRHRGIIDVFSFGQLPDQRPYLVMELLDGQPLDAFIREGAPIPAAIALPILEEILDALDAAHGVGVVHRDLKPNNIFLVQPSRGARYVKLLDFGLAKQSAHPGGATPQTRASVMVGTPEYMAPEQAMGQAVDARTDLYAVGAIAFEMLTGRLPFEAPTPFEIVTKHLREPPPHPSSLEQSVPAALNDLVVSLLAKEPQRRPGTAQLVRREVLRIGRKLQEDSTHLTAEANSPQKEPLAPPLAELRPTPISHESRPTPTTRREDSPTTRTRRDSYRRALFAVAGASMAIGTIIAVVFWSSSGHPAIEQTNPATPTATTKPVDAPAASATAASLPASVEPGPKPSETEPAVSATTTPEATAKNPPTANTRPEPARTDNKDSGKPIKRRDAVAVRHVPHETVIAAPSEKELVFRVDRDEKKARPLEQSNPAVYVALIQKLGAIRDAARDAKDSDARKRVAEQLEALEGRYLRASSRSE